MKTKKIAAILVGVSMLVSLFAGCGNSDVPAASSSTGVSGSANGVSVTGTSSAGTTEAPENGETVIKFGIHVANPKTQEAVTWNIVDAFNEKYDGKYQVEFEAAEKSAHDQNMKLEASDGTLPEIFWCDSAQAPEFLDAGYLLDLSDFLSTNTDTDEALDESITMVYIQRSRGYDTRPSLSVEEIGEIIKAVKEHSNAVVMVDNCYGEFTQKLEPTQVGADIIAGSLIKNAGGGIARTGGYIAGRHDLVEKCAYRLTTPGLGREVGATLGMSRELFLGFYCAPHVVGEALKSAVFAASLFETLGFEASPSSEEKRCDIVQTIKLRKAENLIAFCQGLQKGSPIDAFVTPEPWDMPGYDDKVIMAAGAFTMGSSIELSADGPLREPFAVWMQGGINFYSAKTGIMLAAQEMLNKGLI